MRPITTSQLAGDREDAAAELEHAIALLGIAWRRYGELTQEISDRVGADLTRRLEVPILLHMSRAGLSPLLERKLHGTPVSLRVLVEEEHQRLTFTDPAA